MNNKGDNMKKFKIIIVLVLLTTITTSTYELLKLKNKNNTIYGHTLWPNYDSIEELALDDTVDYIIYGEVINSSPYKQWIIDDLHYIIVTNYTITVLSTIKGSEINTIQVHQDGGTIEDKTQIVLSDPPISLNRKVVLFLHEYSPNNCYVVGGPQGRYVVKNDRVYNVGEVTEVKSSLINEFRIKGQNLTSFIRRIKNVVDE